MARGTASLVSIRQPVLESVGLEYTEMLLLLKPHAPNFIERQPFSLGSRHSPLTIGWPSTQVPGGCAGEPGTSGRQGTQQLPTQ